MSNKLSQLILERIEGGQFTRGDFRAKVGMSEHYLCQLLAGNKSWSGVRTRTLRSVARVLGCSLVTVMLLAGALTEQDFLRAPVHEVLTASYEAMREDADVLPYLPDEATWAALPETVRTSFVMVYRSALCAAHGFA